MMRSELVLYSRVSRSGGVNGLSALYDLKRSKKGFDPNTAVTTDYSTSSIYSSLACFYFSSHLRARLF